MSQCTEHDFTDMIFNHYNIFQIYPGILAFVTHNRYEDKMVELQERRDANILMTGIMVTLIYHCCRRSKSDLYLSITTITMII